MNNVKTAHEPLFHVVKRSNITVWKKLLYYAIAFAVALLLGAVFCVMSSEDSSILDFFLELFNGVFGTERRIWLFLRDGALLLGVALALLPAFKMKFWNLGANGQIVISCLVSYAIMFHLGQGAGWSDAPLILVMIVASVGASIVWAVIPAIFKAFFNTNETLFTLMMNYIAQGLVLVMIKVWAPTGSGSLSPISDYGLIEIINPYLLSIFAVTALTVFTYFYLAKSKHGYELSVVGESVNTARYAGMNVKKIIIRTMLVSGLMCGIIGLLLTGSVNHTVSDSMHGGMGFTAIIAAWLAQFNPLVCIGTCFLITFISRGMGQVKIAFHFYDTSIANVVIGFIYFFIIAGSFFISYKLIFRKKHKPEPAADFMAGNSDSAVISDAKEKVSESEGEILAEPAEVKAEVKEEKAEEVEQSKSAEKPKTAAKKTTAKSTAKKSTTVKTDKTVKPKTTNKGGQK